ncbi:VOC family protein [Rhizobium sp. BR 362]|uniref:VOC family protein n=1 Tax=Rhizobium sp. BR 362 TaxID=3040670 RepID=UPI002F4007C8
MRQGKFIQICVVVEDLERAIRRHSEFFGAGPWFLTKWWEPADDPSIHRGVRRPLGTQTALAYGGDMMFELVAPQPGSQSVFTEWVERRGYGVHHYGFGVEDFDGTLDSLHAAESEIIFSSKTPRGTRIAMIEGDAELGALKEFIEITPATKNFYAFMRQQAACWDGETLIHAGPVAVLD